MFRRFTIVLTLALVLSLTASGLTAQAAEVTSMAALGDSITTAYNAGPSAYRDYLAGSWSTGTVLNSHAQLLVLPTSAVFNKAVSGAKMANLETQAKTVGQAVDYVTILMGGNDICTSTVGGMTDLILFETQFTAAMAVLTPPLKPAPTTTPKRKIFVASIPNVTNLLEQLKGNGSARFIWSLFGICQSLLKSPLSNSTVDIDRRAKVAERNDKLNGILATVCAAFTNCKFDDLAVYKTVFAAGDVSTRDYFHPNSNGQKLLACVTWKASYWAATKTC
jgi:lysophospholipase L1-like esterase